MAFMSNPDLDVGLRGVPVQAKQSNHWPAGGFTSLQAPGTRQERSKTLVRKSKPSSTARFAVGSIAAMAALAVANHFIARRTESNHPAEGSFVEVDGIRLNYRDRGRGSPVVLIHGNVVTGNDWDTSGVAGLLLLNHRVIIFDRPGFGYSERPRGARWTANQQAELLRKALLQFKVERQVVVGHSWGSIVALALAARCQRDIAGLVLLSGYYFWTLRPDVPLAALGALPILGDILRYSISPLLGWLQMPFVKRHMFAPAPVPEEFQTGFSTAMALRPSQIRESSMDGGQMITSVLALRKEYNKLTLPVTIIAGDGDKVVFRRMSERLAGNIPQSTLKIIRGAGHMVHYFAPQRVVQAIDVIAGESLPDQRSDLSGASTEVRSPIVPRANG
jgi:pimeloyl-ACP methyl ester carboxylesterase